MSFSAIVAIGLSLLSQNVEARSWRINSRPDAKANFESINEAMESLEVLNEDTLYLDPGCVLGDQTVSKSVTIIGTGYNLQDETTREAIISGTLNVASDNVKIEGCNINIINCSRHQNTTIERCKVVTISSYYNGPTYGYAGFRVYSSYILNRIDCNRSTGVEISNCIITGPIQDASNASIKNNTIICNGYNSYALSASNSSILNNIILNTNDGYSVDENQKPYYYKNNTIQSVAQENNNVINNNVLSTDAEHAFANFPKNKFIGATPEDIFTMDGTVEEMYKLKEGSPAIGYGANGYDCGAFAGQYPYVISGRPRFMPYIYEANIPNTPTEGKLNITLKIKTQNE